MTNPFRYWNWETWDWDIWTIGWVIWMAFFPVWETITSLVNDGTSSGEMLTDHLRPALISAPVLWFVALGVWLWLGIHLLVPALEAWLHNAVG